MLPDICHLEKIGIQTSLLTGCPEGGLMHGGGTGGNHYPVKPQLLNVLLNQGLARVGTHELVVTGDYHRIQALGILGHGGKINCTGYVTAAMTDINPYPRFHLRLPFY
jgi:hypothetical protein